MAYHPRGCVFERILSKLNFFKFQIPMSNVESSKREVPSKSSELSPGLLCLDWRSMNGPHLALLGIFGKLCTVQTVQIYAAALR